MATLRKPWRPLTQEQQIREALKILAPPKGRREECREYVMDWYVYVEAAKFGTAATQQQNRIHSDALARFRAVNKAHPLQLVDQAILDRAAITIKAMSSWKHPPSFYAVLGAHALLTRYGGKITVSRQGDWQKLAATLLNTCRNDLFQQLRKVRTEILLSHT
jgi:hypothetical protein